MLRAAAGPGERRLWKGIFGAQNTCEVAIFMLNFFICWLDLVSNMLVLSSLQVFQVRKVVGAAAGKIFAMKVLKKVLICFCFFFSLRSSGNLNHLHISKRQADGGGI